MTTIQCPGGHNFSANEAPSPNEYRLISVIEIYEKIVPKILEIIEENSEDLELYIMGIRLSGLTAYTCPICNRLLIVDNNKLVKSYLPESTNPQQFNQDDLSSQNKSVID